MERNMEETALTVNVEEIPAFRRLELAEAAQRLVREVFARPGEEERFQAWLAARRSQA